MVDTYSESVYSNNRKTKGNKMKYLAITSAILLSACMSYDADLEAHLEAERDFHAHQSYLNELYTKYDPEYIDDCLYYQDLVCEFE
jgi:hypothetical protein